MLEGLMQDDFQRSIGAMRRRLRTCYPERGGCRSAPCSQAPSCFLPAPFLQGEPLARFVEGEVLLTLLIDHPAVS